MRLSNLRGISIVHVVIIAIIVYVLWKFLGRIYETFPIEMDPTKPGSYWWNSNTNPRQGYPFYEAPHADDKSEMGDLTLANMYRKWHNLDDITRNEVFEQSYLAVGTPGGDDSVNRQWYIMEELDREMMKNKKRIDDHIRAKRRPYTDAYADGLPHTELGGNYFDCAVTGGCQWNLDNDEQILGIPSVPGVLHPYY